MNILGWDFEQWAIVFAAYPREINGLNDGEESRIEWIKNRLYDPGKELIFTFNEKPKRDYESSRRFFNVVADLLS